IQVVGSSNWGSTVLATLYCEFYQATKHDTKNIDSFLLLLYSWTLHRMSFLASLSHQHIVFPVVN
ncbi:hypothetical protein J1N35_008457, partial [Gossypium stocksii]